VKLEFRETLRESDRGEIESILLSSGFFHPEEITIALELVDEVLIKGTDSGYHFILALQDGHIAGYSCYGPIPCTINRWDLYWIAVSDAVRGKGIGGILVTMTEDSIRRLGGRRAYIETSSRELYLPTRTFYEKMGYSLETVQKDYYDDQDDKCLFVKVLD